MWRAGDAQEQPLRLQEWYAVRIRSRQEKAVAVRLAATGIRRYLPLKKETRQWSDRKQVVAMPPFSGYLLRE